MPQPQPYIVGRQAEVELFDHLVTGEPGYWLLNIYGPGGIGKTVVCSKLEQHAQQRGIPFATVDGIRPDLTPDRLLHFIQEGFSQGPKAEIMADALGDFDRQFREYLIVNEVLQRGGGVGTLFDVVGSIKDPAGLAQILGGLGVAITESVQRTVSNRFALERYLRGVEKSLTAAFADGLGAALDDIKGPVALLVDTYEEMEGLDDWVCRTMAPALPDATRLVVFGRNALPKVNLDWGEFGNALKVMELPELPESEAKAYLVHHGLRDQVALDQVYHFTGGYPLLLVLVVHLQREAGGWNKIGALEYEADRERVATKLLERILREERVKEVQAFLEKGVVARWFTPEVVSVILEVSSEEGHAIYNKLERHSFVEHHPYGLKFHDKIRELLLSRLKFNKPEYDRIVKQLMDYYAEKAGIDQEEEAPATPGPKYEIHIQSAQGPVIGDRSEVTQRVQDPLKSDNAADNSNDEQ